MNKEWKRFASAFRQELMFNIIDPETHKMAWPSLKYKETQYESPKTYNNYLAFNDGSWLIFPKEYRTKDGKPKGIFLARKDKAIREVYYFCRFQKLIGVRLKEELVYHMACFLGDVPKIRDKAFDCNEKNRKLLYKIADNILSSEADQKTLDRLRDTRSFCIDPGRLKVLNRKDGAAIQAKGRKFANYFRILENYDESKSISQNAKNCGVSETTIKTFKKQKSAFESMFKPTR